MNGPRQEPDNREHGEEFENWEDYHPQDKSHSFPDYDDKTSAHTTSKQPQHFHYEGNDLPEKE
jgi:hypothetical protein